jgi:hypothetical protein
MLGGALEVAFWKGAVWGEGRLTAVQEPIWSLR